MPAALVCLRFPYICASHIWNASPFPLGTTPLNCPELTPVWVTSATRTYFCYKSLQGRTASNQGLSAKSAGRIGKAKRENETGPPRRQRRRTNREDNSGGDGTAGGQIGRANRARGGNPPEKAGRTNRQDTGSMRSRKFGPKSFVPERAEPIKRKRCSGDFAVLRNRITTIRRIHWPRGVKTLTYEVYYAGLRMVPVHESVQTTKLAAVMALARPPARRGKRFGRKSCFPHTSNIHPTHIQHTSNIHPTYIQHLAIFT